MPELDIHWKRRTFLAACVAAPIGLLAAKKPRDQGQGGHDDYFAGLQQALRDADLMRPTLVIDRARLDANIALLKQHLPSDLAYRIVAKSLPSVELIRRVRAATGTNRLMVFHQPHLNVLSQAMPDAHLLLGKPMPAGAVDSFFAQYQPGAFDTATQIEWLVDTPQRIADYRELAAARVRDGAGPMALNLELDVGLHRGGFRNTRDVAEAIRSLQADPNVRFAGFMGYEAHASKIPDALGGPAGALADAMAYYADCVEVAKAVLGDAYRPAELTLNAGGSSTYQLYDNAAPCNELAMGSGLVKPSDFDTATLSDHQAAAYIATPVLKHLDGTRLPSLERLSGLFQTWDPNTAQTFFLYGGYWLADTVSPPGLQRNAIWGHSTNQDMLNGSANVELAVGDHVFLRPQQSEFVFLQFGDIAVYEQGRIVDTWPVFPQAPKAQPAQA